MPATHYQKTSNGARRLSLAGLLAWALLVLPGCDRSGREPAPAEDPTQGGRSMHHSRLSVFAPGQLLEYVGGKTTGSTSRLGAVGVSEVERAYADGPREAKVRIVDTTLRRETRAPLPSEAYEDALHVGRPMMASGSIGYVEFEKRGRRARADLIVGDRFVVTVTCESARGPEEAERLIAALDLARLSELARESQEP